VREELRNGAQPQLAIQNGYAHAWATILDSNVTTLIAGLALLAFGSGPVRGFAVVHCIGIMTSMFSAVFFSRGLVNLWYGGKKKLKSLAVGQVWRPATPDGAAAAFIEDDTETGTPGTGGTNNGKARAVAAPAMSKKAAAAQARAAGKPTVRRRDASSNASTPGGSASNTPKKPGSSR
jgi:preprotein translocase subunit SecD